MLMAPPLALLRVIAGAYKVVCDSLDVCGAAKLDQRQLLQDILR